MAVEAPGLAIRFLLAVAYVGVVLVPALVAVVALAHIQPCTTMGCIPRFLGVVGKKATLTVRTHTQLSPGMTIGRRQRGRELCHVELGLDAFSTTTQKRNEI